MRILRNFKRSDTLSLQEVRRYSILHTPRPSRAPAAAPRSGHQPIVCCEISRGLVNTHICDSNNFEYINTTHLRIYTYSKWFCTYTNTTHFSENIINFDLQLSVSIHNVLNFFVNGILTSI